MPHSLPSSKPVLATDPRPSSRAPVPAPLRRYRISRLRIEGRLSDPTQRFEHLKRVYD